MSANDTKIDWRCECGRLLGKRQGNLIHVQISDKYRYTIDGKVTCVCPRCGRLNSEQTQGGASGVK